MRITKLKLLFIALAGLTLLAGHFSGGRSQAAVQEHTRGRLGGGRFNLFSNLTPCNGQVVPSRVFRGTSSEGATISRLRRLSKNKSVSKRIFRIEIELIATCK